MLQSIKEKFRLKTVIVLMPTVLFLFFMYCMMAKTYTGAVKSTVTGMRLSFKGFTTLSESFEKVLQKNFFGKNDYINLNGLLTRILGINSLNERQKLANGHLSYFGDAYDIAELSDSVIELNKFLSDRGIYFVYLLVPAKHAFYDAKFAPGYGSTAWQNIDAMITALADAGVNTIDMDAWFEENGRDMDDVYLKTDHHWRINAALDAARTAMKYLSDRKIADYNESWLSDKNWKITVWKDILLGSHGRRTGTKYAGTDDFDIYFPNFKTDYSFAGLRRGTSNWRYSNSLLDLSYVNLKDYPKPGGKYYTYLYADNPIQVIKNSLAVNEKKLLIVSDSFGRPWTYFMASQFKEIHRVDLSYSDGTFAQYVEEIRPDIVIFCLHSSFDGRCYRFGVDEYTKALEATSGNKIINLGGISVKAQKNNNNSFTVVYTGLKPNQAYTLTLDSAAYAGGKDKYVQMTLQNLSSNKAVYNRYFDANSDKTQKWIFATPKDASGVYAIYLYAGTKGHTKGVSVNVTGVKLRKGIFED